MPAPDTQTEHCERCDRETLHKVWVEIRTESPDAPQAPESSREPYRVRECQECGHRESQRMNNA